MVVTVRKKLKQPTKEQHKLCMFIGVLSLVTLSVLGAFIAYYYTPTRLTPCELVEGLCFKGPFARPAPVPARKYTDEEVAAFAVASELLSPPRSPDAVSKAAFMYLTPGPLPFEFIWEDFFQVANSLEPKVAFMFMTRGPMPLEFIWEEFFKEFGILVEAERRKGLLSWGSEEATHKQLTGQEGKYSVYVHASERKTLKSVWKSKVFIDREIPSGKVYWGGIEMIDAERRLLAHALVDRDNQFFVLVSESCIPLYDFNYIYGSLMNSSYSFVDNFDDPGPHGVGRYMQDKMMPEIQRVDWRKGAQWFAVMRKHALLLVLDHLYYQKFKEYCKRGEANRNCYPDEHYVQTFLHIMDPSGLSNWTVTYVDWSDGGWHPRAYGSEDITVDALERIQRIDEHVHVTSNLKAIRTAVPCMWEGEHRPCFLFARKFLPDSAEALARLLPEVINSSKT